MMHIANATLAGGVAIGTSANVILDPVDSLLIGTVAGIVSVIGYKYITVSMLSVNPEMSLLEFPCQLIPDSILSAPIYILCN